MDKRLLLFFPCFFLSLGLFAQKTITGTVATNGTDQPIAFATISSTTGQHVLTNIDGTFEIVVEANTNFLHISYLGYQPVQFKLISGKNHYEIRLKKSILPLEKVVLQSDYLAKKVIRKAIANKAFNQPSQKLRSFQYHTYSKFIIDNEQDLLNLSLDSARAAIETIVNTGRAFLSEKVSLHKFHQHNGKTEKILATETAGFDRPVYEFLTVKIQSSSWYNDKYVIFDGEYAGPLGKKAFKNYRYKILDTTTTERPAYLVYFQPQRQQAVAGLEGVLYIDTLSYAVQKAIGQLKGAVNIKTQQDYRYFPKEEIWFPTKKTLFLEPGNNQREVSIFGGNISVGRLPEKDKDSTTTPMFMQSVSINSDIKLNKNTQVDASGPKIEVLPEATEKSGEFWENNRKTVFSNRDKATFARVDSIIKAENIQRKIEVVQNFNQGYFPVGFFDIDLRKLVKYNNYEGLRLGIGGLTNEKLSKKFRVGGYVVYGFIDHTFKYSVETGFLLSKKSNTWLNFKYTDDLREVGSYFYLTDLQVYSLFEPRLVNIDFYYKHKTIQADLQHRISQNLSSVLQLSHSDISQTRNYYFKKKGENFHRYKLTEATLSLRWSPFSSYLKSPEKLIEIEKKYPKFSTQITHAFDGFLDGDFSYTKVGVKADYIVHRINQSSTELTLEGNYAFGELPLTHTFHAYPNNPNRDALLQRFSVAGRRSFETMYFSEFFSDRLATLQIKHRFRAFDLGANFRPQLVLITRHAIGDMSDKNKHFGLQFNTLEKGYSESGFEINNIFLGFGLSFAYRYGAYHLPVLADNISAKFTFYFKL